MEKAENLGIEEYVRLYVGRLSPVWAIDRTQEGCEVSFPNGGGVLLKRSQIDWSQPFPTDAATSTLWYHSLTYVPYLHIENDDWNFALELYGSYATWLQRSRELPDYAPINSIDHAHAAQLLAVCASMAVHRTNEGWETSAATSVLVDFMEVIANASLTPGMIKANNHGLMLARALIHAGYVFAGLTDVAERCRRIGSAEFQRVVQGAFDGAGVVNENTPAYQILYMRIIDSMIDFVERTGDADGHAKAWRALMARSRSSLGLQLMPGNMVPPIGDDAGGASPYPGVDGELISVDNGLYVDKSEDWYVSIISGYRGVVHKHPDDTSIRLQYKGQDLLIDAGLLNYDVSDPIGTSVVSQRGHSGLYFRRFDQVRPVDIFLARPPRVLSRIGVGKKSDGSRRIVCQYEFDEDYRAQRVYTRPSKGLFLIEDSFLSPGHEAAVQRYLLPKEGRISWLGSAVRVSFENAAIEIRVERGATVTVYNGDEGPAPRGWRAARHYEPDRCWCIEVDPRAGSTSMRASISVIAPGELLDEDALAAFWKV